MKFLEDLKNSSRAETGGIRNRRCDLTTCGGPLQSPAA